MALNLTNVLLNTNKFRRLRDLFTLSREKLEWLEFLLLFQRRPIRSGESFISWEFETFFLSFLVDR
jgi:hypothetical protein